MRFYFEHIIDTTSTSQVGKCRQAYCPYRIRETLIRYGGGDLLVWRNALFLHFIIMGNVMDSTLIHINKGNAKRTDQQGLISLYNYWYKVQKI